jgi:hypothetical protein
MLTIFDFFTGFFFSEQFLFSCEESILLDNGPNAWLYSQLCIQEHLKACSTSWCGNWPYYIITLAVSLWLKHHYDIITDLIIQKQSFNWCYNVSSKLHELKNSSLDNFLTIDYLSPSYYLFWIEEKCYIPGYLFIYFGHNYIIWICIYSEKGQTIVLHSPVVNHAKGFDRYSECIKYIYYTPTNEV